VEQSRWSLNEMTICQKKIHGKKNEFNGYKPVELNHFSQKKAYYPVNFQSQRLLQYTGISALISASTAMGKFESSNNLNMTRKALKKTFRQSPNTRRSSATTTQPKKKTPHREHLLTQIPGSELPSYLDSADGLEPGTGR
jgi:hypothetical protein